MTKKSAFPALYALISPAWERGSPHVEDLALPKSLKNGNFTLAKAIIRWMSAKTFINVLLGPRATDGYHPVQREKANSYQSTLEKWKAS